MSSAFLNHVDQTLVSIRRDGLYKVEREITSPQSGKIAVQFDGELRNDIINLCANNYLGLANHPELIEAAQTTMEAYGYGMSSVRFICGTQDLHRKLARRLAQFLEKDDTYYMPPVSMPTVGCLNPCLVPKMPLSQTR